jgi:cell division protein FtsI/penicillin-binding protein 2
MPINPQQKGAMVHRFTLFVMFLGIMMALLVVRLWFLQVVQGDRYHGGGKSHPGGAA